MKLWLCLIDVCGVGLGNCGDLVEVGGDRTDAEILDGDINISNDRFAWLEVDGKRSAQTGMPSLDTVGLAVGRALHVIHFPLCIAALALGSVIFTERTGDQG